MPVFRLEAAEGGIVHLVMDHPARKVNVLDEPALRDLDAAITELEGRKPAGVVLRSGKPGSFIAGADVDAIGAITDPEQVRMLVRGAHAAFGRLAALACPTIAAIDGVCLGGGTELALACDTRIAAEERTSIGLPETQLGIFPAFGGTTRLPRLIGVVAALDLILTGRAVDARRAEKMGLIARAVPGAWLIERAHQRLAELSARPGGARSRRDRFHSRGFAQWLIEGTPAGRAFVLSQARANVQKRTGGHYPAPFAAIDVMARGLGRPVEKGLDAEAARVPDLVVGPVCKNLVRLFQLSERTKKDSGVKPLPVRTLALVGAGVMGGGIAELASRNGLQVRLRDLAPAALTRALETAHERIVERAKRRGGRRRPGSSLPNPEHGAQMARILPTLELTGFGRCDLALEAVVEDLDVKRRVLAELEVRIRPDALLATNTSSLSVGALAGGLRLPERFVGIHFFNPVHRMPLVEVVKGPRTSEVTLATAVALSRKLGKTPVVVNDAPGFVVNRVLMPYLREALHLLEERYAIGEVDAAMRGFGMPMGPFELLDEVGIDVAQKVATVLSRAFPDRMAPSSALETLLAAGRLGKKSGLGFYRHQGGKREPDPRVRGLLKLKSARNAQSGESLSERMVLAMINESARCLDDGVVPDAGLVDLAIVFGAGFPPWRGGPLRHADTIGLTRVESRLRALRAERGERFAPAALLIRLAAAGGTFTAPPTPPARG